MPDNDALRPPPGEQPRDRIPSLGHVLRSAREAERLSIDRVAAEVRIEPRFLIALEEERFEAVGPPVFVKGYLKLYCECLGLDFARLEPLYRAQAGDREPPFEGRRSVEHRDRSPSGFWLAVGLAGTAVVVLLAFWVVGGPSPQGVEPSLPVESTAAPAPAGAEAETGAEAQTGAPENAVSALQEALSQRVPGRLPREPAAQGEAPGGPGEAPGGPGEAPGGLGEALGGPGEARGGPRSPAAPDVQARVAPANAGASPAGAPGSSASPVGGGPRSVAEPGSAAAGAGGGASAADVAGGAGTAADEETAADVGPALEIELQFLQDSWVEVSDARNVRLYYGLGKAGDQSRLSGRPPLDVLLGNADGVRVEVAGRPYSYPPRRRHGNVVHFTVAGPAE